MISQKGVDNVDNCIPVASLNEVANNAIFLQAMEHELISIDKPNDVIYLII